METFNEEKLVKYQMDEKEIVVGFATYQDAERRFETFKIVKRIKISSI